MMYSVILAHYTTVIQKTYNPANTVKPNTQQTDKRNWQQQQQGIHKETETYSEQLFQVIELTMYITTHLWKEKRHADIIIT